MLRLQLAISAIPMSARSGALLGSVAWPVEIWPKFCGTSHIASASTTPMAAAGRAPFGASAARPMSASAAIRAYTARSWPENHAATEESAFASQCGALSLPSLITPATAAPLSLPGRAWRIAPALQRGPGEGEPAGGRGIGPAVARPGREREHRIQQDGSRAAVRRLAPPLARPPRPSPKYQTPSAHGSDAARASFTVRG